MSPSEWTSTVTALSDADVSACVQAAERLHRESRVEDVERLLALLESNDFFVREAAAWPLAELVGPSVLPQLLAAYQRGFYEGRDNDGFTAALLEIPGLHVGQARSSLERIAASADEPMRGHAAWLLDFCEPSATPSQNGA